MTPPVSIQAPWVSTLANNTLDASGVTFLRRSIRDTASAMCDAAPNDARTDAALAHPV